METSAYRPALYGLAILPVVTDFIERGAMPSEPRGWLTELVAGIVTLILVHRVVGYMYMLDHQARTDPLTGLLNRRAFSQVLARECARSERTSTDLTLIVLDVDRFKLINDLDGHAVGDAVLKAIGAALNRSMRKAVDRACRLGGDEFALLLPHTTAAQARLLLARVELFCRAGDARFADGRIALSAGIVERQPDELPESLLLRADQAMYRRKAQRKLSVGDAEVATGYFERFTETLESAPL